VVLATVSEAATFEHKACDLLWFPREGESLMTTEAKTKALLEAIERRLTDISAKQHALAVEKARLLEHITPLRLGVLAPDTAVSQLKAKGITFRGLTAQWSGSQRPRRPILKAVVAIRPAMPLAR
jgi:hypothetical protein